MDQIASFLLLNHVCWQRKWQERYRKTYIFYVMEMCREFVTVTVDFMLEE